MESLDALARRQHIHNGPSFEEFPDSHGCLIKGASLAFHTSFVVASQYGWLTDGDFRQARHHVADAPPVPFQHVVAISGVIQSSGAAIATVSGGQRLEQTYHLSSITIDSDWALFKINNRPDKVGIAADIFEPLARAGIDMDLILQNVSLDGLTAISFSVRSKDLSRTIATLQTSGYGDELEVIAPVSILVVTGTALRRSPAILSRLFSTLGQVAINIQCISMGNNTITSVVDPTDAQKARDALLAQLSG